MDVASKWGTYRPSLPASLYIAALKHHIAHGSLKWRLRRALKSMNACYDVWVEGVRIRCHVRDNATEADVLQYNSRSDRGGAGKLLGPLRPGDTFVDVGANSGMFSLLAALKVGSGGRVVAVEPLAEMLARLRFNAKANDFDQISIYETAVGEAAGEITLHVCERQFGETSVAALDGQAPRSVSVRPLLDIVKDAGLTRIDALKIDIEGHEDRALSPFFSSAPKALWPRRVLMEFWHRSRWQTNCIAEMTAAGYRELWHDKYDVLLELNPEHRD